MTAPRTSTGGTVTRVIGIVLTVVFGAPFLLFSWMALSSRFAWGGTDPHGYALIFGTLLALVAALATAMVAPLIVRSGQRGSAYGWSMLGFILMAAALITSLLTA